MTYFGWILGFFLNAVLWIIEVDSTDSLSASSNHNVAELGLQNNQLNSIFLALLRDRFKTIGIYTTIAVGDQDDLPCVCQPLGNRLDHVDSYNERRDGLTS